MENSKMYQPLEKIANYLNDNKKIMVNDGEERVFLERSYSSLINPYKDYFSFGKGKEKKRIYRLPTDLSEYMKLAKLDDNFSSLLYLFIGTFERKFKALLFKEICDKYYDEKCDFTCTSYVNEIDDFINSTYQKLPIFCPNLNTVLSKKGRVEDKYDISKKISLLKRIKEMGTGRKVDGNKLEKNNKLISHYINEQGVAPLWTIPNALTFGELQMLFLMLDINSQKRIITDLENNIEWRKLINSKLLSFSGYLEIIRNLRNIINHYEPIMPFLVNNMKKAKKIENTQIYFTIKFLEKVYNSSKVKNINNDHINIDYNNFNSKAVRILNLVKEQME